MFCGVGAAEAVDGGGTVCFRHGVSVSVSARGRERERGGEREIERGYDISLCHGGELAVRNGIKGERES